MTDCLRDSDLDGFLRGRLDNEAKRRARTHLQTCRGCSQRLVTLVSSAASDDSTATDHVDALIRGPRAAAIPPISASQSPSQQTDSPIIPDYEPIRMIGSGGFGSVWLARQKLTDVLYAVKVVPRHGAKQLELSAVREYKQRVLDHSHLVRLEHVGETSDFLYYVMELADDVRGPGTHTPEGYEAVTLAEEMGRLGTLEFERAVRIVREILKGLGHLHATGLLHRDIKPQNILRRRGQWILGDIGLVTRHTSVQDQPGTPAYAPPERVLERSGDLYSVGVLLCELVLGRGPIQSLAEARTGAGPDDSELESLRDIVQRACHEDPTARFQNTMQMTAALDRLLPAARSRAPKTVPNLLPFLPNRSVQERALQQALQDSDPTRPFICIVQGDEFQCEDMFLERLKCVSLRRHLRLGDHDHIQDILLKWPTAHRNGTELALALRQDLAEHVLEDPAASIHNIATAITQSRGVAVVHTHLLPDDFKYTSRNLVSEFVHFWSQWPESARRQRTVVCLFLRYPRRTTRLAWAFGGSRLTARIRKHLKAIAWQQCQGVLLPELEGVCRRDVEDWARSEAKQFGAADLIRDIRDVYERFGSQYPNACIPMEHLACELKTILDSRTRIS